MVFTRNTLLALLLSGAVALAAPTEQTWNDLDKPTCYSVNGGQYTKEDDIKAIYEKLSSLDSPTIPAHLESSESASGTQLYYCRSSALVLVNSNEQDITVDLASLTGKLDSFDPTQREGCSYEVSSLQTDTTTADSEALGLGIDLYSAGYESGGNKTEWDDELAAFAAGSEERTENVC